MSRLMRSRHWYEIVVLCEKSIPFQNPDKFFLHHLLEADLLRVKDKLLIIYSTADKQSVIEQRLKQIDTYYSKRQFHFKDNKTQDFPWNSVSGVMGRLEEDGAPVLAWRQSRVR